MRLVPNRGFSPAIVAINSRISGLNRGRVGAENSERGRFGAEGADLGRVRQDDFVLFFFIYWALRRVLELIVVLGRSWSCGGSCPVHNCGRPRPRGGGPAVRSRWPVHADRVRRLAQGHGAAPSR